MTKADHRDMAEFINSLDDNRMRALLAAAVERRRFEDVLDGHPAERERWVAFKTEKLARRMRRRVDCEGN